MNLILEVRKALAEAKQPVEDKKTEKRPVVEKDPHLFFLDNSEKEQKHRDTLIARTQEKIDQANETNYPITRLKRVSPTSNRYFIGIFETSHDELSRLPFSIAHILKKWTNDVLKKESTICLEFPIERTGLFEKGLFGDDLSNDEDEKDKFNYTNFLKKFCNNHANSVVCFDDWDFLDSPTFKDYFFKYCNYLKSRKEYTHEQAYDCIRNQIMVYAMTYFTSTPFVISINGVAHTADLVSRLKATNYYQTFVPIRVMHSKNTPWLVKQDNKGILIVGDDELNPSHQFCVELLQLTRKCLRENYFQPKLPSNSQSVGASYAQETLNRFRMTGQTKHTPLENESYPPQKSSLQNLTLGGTH